LCFGGQSKPNDSTRAAKFDAKTTSQTGIGFSR
jgi:hypothetical protein